MNVYIQLLRPSDETSRLLSDDGWKLDPAHPEFAHSLHCTVADESAGRSRLMRLGLLTSSSVRVEFRRVRKTP
jgi:hypothetical protein